MTRWLGTQAIVVGAGIGDLTAVCALAWHFARMLVLERDTLPPGAAARAGVPQGRYAHALLAGGHQAFCALFPGFEQDLARAGAIALTVGRDIRIEQPGYGPFPQRGLAFHYPPSFLMPSPL